MLTKQDLQAVIDLCSDHYNLTNPPKLTHWRNTQCGKAFLMRRTITLPNWPLYKHGEDYMVAYTVHEVTHFIAHNAGDNNHGKIFKSIEKDLLGLFGYTPIFTTRRAYYNKLISANGDVLYKRKD